MGRWNRTTISCMSSPTSNTSSDGDLRFEVFLWHGDIYRRIRGPEGSLAPAFSRLLTLCRLPGGTHSARVTGWLRTCAELCWSQYVSHNSLLGFLCLGWGSTDCV